MASFTEPLSLWLVKRKAAAITHCGPRRCQKCRVKRSKWNMQPAPVRKFYRDDSANFKLIPQQRGESL
jgi:hypothetical protein